MSFTATQDTPILVDLTAVAQTTGWSIVGDSAVHQSCNSGNIELVGYTIQEGKTYSVSYRVISISGGSVRMFMGTTGGVSRTTAGDYSETILATGTDPILYFYSDANCEIKAFNIQEVGTDVSPTQKYTVVYSPVINKWTSFYTMAPDFGFSMFIRTLVFQYGVMYSQQNGSVNRNNLFGTVYDSLFQFVENKNTAMVQTYQALSIQANQLIITTNDGIESSLGQLSTLIDTDFIQQSLSDGNINVDIYDRYGVYMASFVGDQFGDELKGNYLIVQLQSTDSENPMQIFTVDIKTAVQKIGAR